MRAHLLAADGQTIVNTIEVESLNDLPGLIDASIGGDIGDKIVGGAVVKKPAVVLTSAQVESGSSDAIQELLEDVAKAHGYDSIISLCSYATSVNAKWKAEGLYGCSYRDACWSKAQDIENAVLAGTIPLPTVAWVIAQMPAVAWPV